MPDVIRWAEMISSSLLTATYIIRLPVPRSWKTQ